MHGPLDYAYYTNYIEGLPDNFWYRNTTVNLISLAEPEDIPLDERMQEGDDGDDDSAGSTLNPGYSSDSGNTEIFFSGAENFSGSDVEDDQADNDQSEGQNQDPPRRRLFLEGDPYGPYYPSNQGNPSLHISLLNQNSNPNPNPDPIPPQNKHHPN